MNTLNLVGEIFKKLSLNIEDAEILRNAFLVQPLVAPLVRFSNRGRYEPYVAKSWKQNGNSWIFEIAEGLICEDGQSISPESLAHSLIRSLRKHSREELSQTPFIHLLNIANLNSPKSPGKELGIVANATHLELVFVQPVGKVLLEYLSMTPYAFLCEANFSGDKWISNDHLISSGPYRVSSFEQASDTYELEARSDWALNKNIDFQKIRLSPTTDPKAETQMTMTYAEPVADAKKANVFLEVPRALVSLRLGIENRSFFAERAHRLVFSHAINKVLDNCQIPFENYHRASSFFFGQVTGHEMSQELQRNKSGPPKPLLIRGRPGRSSADNSFLEGLIAAALTELNWPFEFSTNERLNAADYYSKTYDISLDASHVDSTLDPDILRNLFLSKFGPRYQDPGNRVAKLLDTYDSGKMSYRDFLVTFNGIITEESAVIPLFHRGFTWVVPDSIETQSLSPLMSIIRFEELKLNRATK